MDARDELIIELLARRDATDDLLGDFIGHPRYERMSYAQAADRATAFNIYFDSLDRGYGPEIEGKLLDFEADHEEVITARAQQLLTEARAKNPSYRNKGANHG